MGETERTTATPPSEVSGNIFKFAFVLSDINRKSLIKYYQEL